MSGNLNVDQAGMQKITAQFEADAAQLKTEMSKLNTLGGEMTASFSGTAGSAFQTKMAAYQEAASTQLQEITRIIEMLQQASASYSSTDEAQSSSISSAANSMSGHH